MLFTNNVVDNSTVFEINENLIIISFAETYINKEERECTICYMHTDENYLGQGYGTRLLEYIKKVCRELGVKKIFLDDCSDRFNQPDGNIYVRNGFRYIKKRFPEMVYEL